MKDKIILDNLNLINKVMKDLNCEIKSQDDYEQYYYAGLIGLIKSSRKYDSSKGKSGYLYKGIKRYIIAEFIKNSTKKRYGLKKISLNIEINNIELINYVQSSFNLEKYVIDKIYLKNILNELKNKSYKTYLIEYYINDLSLVEIAKKHGVSKQDIHQSIHYALGKLREIIKEKK